MSRRRSWPFCGALIGFVVTLGVLPHARFSMALGEPAVFFGAYDEPAYVLWAFEGGGPLLPHRWLSSLLLRALAVAGGGSWASALVLADVVCPALCAAIAWYLTGTVTRRRTLRLAVALGLLFAQELFSLGCWTIWQVQEPLGVAATLEPALYDVRTLRTAVPAGIRALWPDYASPFPVLFRTPEPQMSLVLLLAMLVVLSRLCSAGRLPRALFAAGIALNAALIATYVFVAATVVVLEGALAAALLCWRRRPQAARAFVLALTGGSALLAGVAAFHSGGHSQVYSFGSRLPILTPAVILACAGLPVTWRRSRFELAPLATACFGCVLFLTNQQVLSGRMITTQFWERYANYPLVYLGAVVLVADLLRRSALRLEVLYAAAGAWLVAAPLLLTGAQNRVFEREFLVANLESVAAERTLARIEAQGVRDPVLLFEDPNLDLLVEARLERRAAHVLDLTHVFEQPLEPIERAEGRWGVRSPFAREAFEYFARWPRTAPAVERLLTAEAETGAGTFLRFFFEPRDFWSTITDERRARLEDVRAQIPAIRAAYEAYLEAGDPCWSRPVVVLTRQNAAQRAHPRWQERLLAHETVGRGAAIMNMHAYLQEPAGGTVSGACR